MFHVRFGTAFFSPRLSFFVSRSDFPCSISNRHLTRESFFMSDNLYDLTSEIVARLDPTFHHPMLTRWKLPDSHVFKPSIQGSVKKKVMSRFVSGTRRYEFPIASFSPRFILPVYHKLSSRYNGDYLTIASDALSRKTARRNRYTYANKLAATIYTNNTITHTQCSNITMYE